MLLLRRWARMVCHSAVLPCSAAAASPVLACMVCYGTVLPRPPALPWRHCSVIIKPLLNVESKLNHYCSLWGAGEGVPVPPLCVSYEACFETWVGIRYFEGSSILGPKGGSSSKSRTVCWGQTAPKRAGTLPNSSGARRLASEQLRRGPTPDGSLLYSFRTASSLLNRSKADGARFLTAPEPTARFLTASKRAGSDSLLNSFQAGRLAS